MILVPGDTFVSKIQHTDGSDGEDGEPLNSPAGSTWRVQLVYGNDDSMLTMRCRCESTGLELAFFDGELDDAVDPLPLHQLTPGDAMSLAGVRLMDAMARWMALRMYGLQYTEQAYMFSDDSPRAKAMSKAAAGLYDMLSLGEYEAHDCLRCLAELRFELVGRPNADVIIDEAYRRLLTYQPHPPEAVKRFDFVAEDLADVIVPYAIPICRYYRKTT